MTGSGDRPRLTVMAASTDVFRSADGAPDWLGPRRRRFAAPSWLLSSLFHALFLTALILISQSKGCQRDFVGEGGEGFREVGLYLTEDAPSPETNQPQPLQRPEPPVPSPLTLSAMPAVVPDRSPVELPEPAASGEPLLGLGGPPNYSAGPSSLTSTASTADVGAAPSLAGTTSLGSTTSMFGISDAGRRFAYVLDHSGSMDDYGALRVAKAELMASLERLDATQQFQVIFYSTTPTILLPRSGRSDMFRGTDTHRLEVQQQLGSIQPDGGTRHWEALLAAMKTNPDVIFFLTDAQEPALTAEQLKDIRQRNGGSARIHCIEFGRTPNVAGTPGVPQNFLQKLADQNDGQYQYRDVRQFR